EPDHVGDVLVPQRRRKEQWRSIEIDSGRAVGQRLGIGLGRRGQGKRNQRRGAGEGQPGREHGPETTPAHRYGPVPWPASPFFFRRGLDKLGHVSDESSFGDGRNGGTLLGYARWWFASAGVLLLLPRQWFAAGGAFVIAGALALLHRR